MAVRTIVDFCQECFPCDPHVVNIKSMFRTAFNYTYKIIARRAAQLDCDVSELDTTLTVLLWNGDTAVYGHSGDGGILGLTKEGEFRQITQPQKGPDGISVRPLRAGFREWVIDSCREDFVSFLLLTDGMLDVFLPYLLKLSDTQKEGDGRRDEIYHSLALVFLDLVCEIYQKDDWEIQEIISQIVEGQVEWKEYLSYLKSILVSRLSQKQAEQALESFAKGQYPLTLLKNVEDDRTVVGVLRKETYAKTGAFSAYLEPDWEKLQGKWARKAYPGMQIHKEESTDKKSQQQEESMKKGSDQEEIVQSAPPAVKGEIAKITEKCVPNMPIRKRRRKKRKRRKDKLAQKKRPPAKKRKENNKKKRVKKWIAIALGIFIIAAVWFLAYLLLPQFRTDQNEKKTEQRELAGTEEITEPERIAETEEMTEPERITETEGMTEPERITEAGNITESERITETIDIMETERTTEQQEATETDEKEEKGKCLDKEDFQRIKGIERKE